MARPVIGSRGRLLAGVALAAIVAGLAARAWLGSRSEETAAEHFRPLPSSAARVAFEQGLDTLVGTLDALATALRRGTSGSRRAAFRAARRAYKRVEAPLALYGPTVVAELNGPLPEESEDRPAGPLGAPAGFQIIEAALFSGDSPGPDSLRATIGSMRSAAAQFRTFTSRLAVTDSAVLEALRLEIARVVTLGLAGFDADRSGDAVVESADALDGCRVLAGGIGYGARIDSTLAAAAAHLRANPSFDGLDRLTFIVAYANPAWRAVADARARLRPSRPLRRLWRTEATTLFERDAFDPTAFAPDFAPRSSPALIALGAALFREPRLSGPGTRSCAFCHDPAHAFTDGRPSSPVLAHATVPRNTPTLWNAAYQPALFDDLRAGSLELQAEMVLASPAEMGGNETLAARRLAEDTSWRRRFAGVFGGSPDSAVTPRALRVALAAYVRSLRAVNSPFDRAARGDTSALTPDARRGFTLFMGKGRCATCHFVPLFNGTMPPDFVVSEPEIIGVPRRPVVRGALLDQDVGRAGVDHEATHRYAFRVPTLRNVALTAPYMHNGAYARLSQVIDFYNRGGGAGVGARVPGQTLPSRELHLTALEQREILAFLGALTDTVPD